MSTGLALFNVLCEVGDGIEYARDRHAPGSDDWTILTEILGWLDGAVDILVVSQGLQEPDDAEEDA